MSIQYDRYVQALRHNWWIILLALAIALGVALGRASLATPVYSTNSTYIISPAAAIEDSADFLRGLNTLDQESVALTYAEIMVANRIKLAAADAIDMDEDTASLYAVEAIQLPDSNVLRLTVSGPSAGKVTELANGIGAQAIDFGQELYPIYEIQVLDRAPVPSSPISPTPARDAAFAAVVGIGLGLLIAVFADDLRTLIRSGVVETPVQNEGVEAS